MNYENLKWDLATLYARWDELGDIPVDEAAQYTEAPFLHFAAGSEVEEIWHWFESVNPRFLVGEVMSGLRLTPITTRIYKWPAFDRNGVQICLGDKLKAQVCTGPYGRVEVFDFDVPNEHYQHGILTTAVPGPKQVASFAFEPVTGRPDIKADVGYRRNNDFEHAHEQWAEVVVRAAASPVNAQK